MLKLLFLAGGGHYLYVTEVMSENWHVLRLIDDARVAAYTIAHHLA